MFKRQQIDAAAAVATREAAAAAVTAASSAHLEYLVALCADILHGQVAEDA